MEAIGVDQLQFVVHGTDTATDDMVSAAVFARKLGALVRALRAADKAVNRGVEWHDYKIARLHTSSPTAILQERTKPKYGIIRGRSGIDALDRCAGAIAEGNVEQARSFGQCAMEISRLAKGSQREYGYAEIWTTSSKVWRVDPFLMERAVAVIQPESAMPEEDAAWYKGVAYGSFDGVVQVVDVRGALPQIKLVLSAGGKQIDCVCRSEDIESIRNALNRRVWVDGRAIYDGKSGLPRRIEVSAIRLVQERGDFTRWKGAFEAFEIPMWEGDED